MANPVAGHPRVIGAWGRFWPGTALGDVARLWALPRPGLAQDDRGHLISCAAGAGYDINRCPYRWAGTSSGTAGGRPSGLCDGSGLGVSDSVDAEHVVDGLGVAGCHGGGSMIRTTGTTSAVCGHGDLAASAMRSLTQPAMPAESARGRCRRGVRPSAWRSWQPAMWRAWQPAMWRDREGSAGSLRFSFVRSSSVPPSAGAGTGLRSPGWDVLRLGRGVRAGRAHRQLSAGRGRRGLRPGRLWLRVSARRL